MKAVIFPTYGSPDVLKIVELEKPTPKDDEVLVKVCASSVNIAEWYAMSGLFLARIGNGLFKPKDTRLGVDFSGVVEAVGKDVSDFKPGDEVFGALAESLTLPGDVGWFGPAGTWPEHRGHGLGEVRCRVRVLLLSQRLRSSGRFASAYSLA